MHQHSLIFVAMAHGLTFDVMLKRGMRPSHPGAILREDYIKERGLTITEAAKRLGVPRPNLSAILNERAGISPKMAVKLSETFGGSTQFWTNIQKNYEVWNTEKKVDRSNIRHFWQDGRDLQPV